MENAARFQFLKMQFKFGKISKEKLKEMVPETITIEQYNSIVSNK